jgi:hypothetical protein
MKIHVLFLALLTCGLTAASGTTIFTTGGDFVYGSDESTLLPTGSHLSVGYFADGFTDFAGLEARTWSDVKSADYTEVFVSTINPDGRLSGNSSEIGDILGKQLYLWIFDSLGAPIEVRGQEFGLFTGSNSEWTGKGPSEGVLIFSNFLLPETVTNAVLGKLVTNGIALSSVSGGPGSWYDGAADLGGGWKWLPWLGSFNVNEDPWIYHAQHGWLYSFTTSSQSVYFWDGAMASILYTSDTLYPSMYRFSDGKWIFYQKGSKNPRWFVDLLTGLWEQW